MGLFSRNKGDSMSRKAKRETTTVQGPDGSENYTEEELPLSEQEQLDAAGADAAMEEEKLALAPQREDESDDDYRLRQQEHARLALNAAEAATAERFARRPEESDGDYQARLDQELLGQQDRVPTPVDPTYTMPEVPTLADQRSYLAHYQLADESDIEAMSPEAVAEAILRHGEDLRARQQQGAMRGETPDALPLNPTLEQLRSYVALKGIVPATVAQMLDLTALGLLVRDAPSVLDTQPQGPTVDMTPVAGALSDQPFGGEPPQYYVVLEQKALYLDGAATTFQAAQIINDRSHDIEGIKRLGVRLLECAPPNPIQ